MSDTAYTQTARRHSTTPTNLLGGRGRLASMHSRDERRHLAALDGRLGRSQQQGPRLVLALRRHWQWQPQMHICMQEEQCGALRAESGSTLRDFKGC